MAPVCNHFFGIDSFFAGSQSPSYYLLMIGTPNLQVLLHPPKLTSPLKRVHFKRKVIFLFFRAYASFPGSKSALTVAVLQNPQRFLTSRSSSPCSSWSRDKSSGVSVLEKRRFHHFHCTVSMVHCMVPIWVGFTTSSRNFSSHTPFSHNSLG